MRTSLDNTSLSLFLAQGEPEELDEMQEDGSSGLEADMDEGDSTLQDESQAVDDSELPEDRERRLRVEGMIKDATDTTERNVEYCNTLIDELKNNKHNDIVEEMVKQMGGKVAKTSKTNIKNAVDWLESDPSRRPFIFLTVEQLKVRAFAAASLLLN